MTSLIKVFYHSNNFKSQLPANIQLLDLSRCPNMVHLQLSPFIGREEKPKAGQVACSDVLLIMCEL